MTDLKTRIELLETNQSTMANLCDVLSLVLAEATTNEEHKKRADLARSVFKTLATAFTPSDATYSWEDEALARRYATMISTDVHRGIMDRSELAGGDFEKGEAFLLIKVKDMKMLLSSLMTDVPVKGEPRTPMTDEEATDEVLNGRW